MAACVHFGQPQTKAVVIITMNIITIQANNSCAAQLKHRPVVEARMMSEIVRKRKAGPGRLRRIGKIAKRRKDLEVSPIIDYPNYAMVWKVYGPI